MKALHEAYPHTLRQEDLRVQAGLGERVQIKDIFQRHPLYKKLILPMGKGVFGLAPLPPR